jgi:hypothetical protein
MALHCTVSVQGPRHTVLYMPDVDGWEQLKAAGTDIRQAWQRPLHCAAPCAVQGVSALFGRCRCTSAMKEDHAPNRHQPLAFFACCCRCVQVVDEAVDVALLDATFWSSEELPGRDMAVVPHPLASHTVQLLAQPRRARVVLVHLNHTNPLNREGPERAACAAAGLEIGEQGSVYAL